MDDIKQAGKFLYQYQGDDTVLIARKAILSNLAGQMLVNKTMSGIAEHTHHFKEIEFGGCIYAGTIFKAIPEDKLIATLEAAD